MKVVTHRGLNASKENYFEESSIEAFSDQLNNGYGLEFDLQITKDQKIIVAHDHSLKRMSRGVDTRKICDVNSDEVLGMDFNGCHLASLDALIELINKKQASGAISAIHVKHGIQNKKDLDILLGYLKKDGNKKFMLFDIKIETAKYLKEKNPNLNLAPSIAHSYDIKRYNDVVGGTLMNIDEALAHTELFNWVWLDEWDRNSDDGTKKFYTGELFREIRKAGLKISLVTPELHSSSPGLLGSEKHQDAINKKILFERIKEIIKLRPDIVCTDYPDEVRKLIKTTIK